MLWTLKGLKCDLVNKESTQHLLNHWCRFPECCIWLHEQPASCDAQTSAVITLHVAMGTGYAYVFDVQVSAVPTSFSYLRIYTVFCHVYLSKLEQYSRRREDLGRGDLGGQGLI